MAWLRITKDFLKRKMLDFFKSVPLGVELLTPMEIVIQTLRANNILPSPLVALELFGRHGLWATADYAAFCQYLEFLEIDPKYANFAKHYFPNAVVKCGDSFALVKEKKLARSKYNFIVIDNPLWGIYGKDYCEHFNLFPQIFDYSDTNSMLVINICWDVSSFLGGMGDNEITDWFKRRTIFYCLEGKSSGQKIEVNQIVRAYEQKASQCGFQVRRSFIVPRYPNQKLGLLVLCLAKKI